MVAWQGNTFPTSYDLADFSPVGTVRVDHPDPSIYTVLSAPPDSPFQPGCCFITPSLTAHGPSGRAVERSRAIADAEADAPSPPGDSLWFQFETAMPLSLTPWAEENRIPEWPSTWGSHRSYFRR